MYLHEHKINVNTATKVNHGKLEGEATPMRNSYHGITWVAKDLLCKDELVDTIQKNDSVAVFCGDQ